MKTIKGISSITNIDFYGNFISDINLVAEVFPKAERANLSMNMLTKIVDNTKKYLKIFA